MDCFGAKHGSDSAEMNALEFPDSLYDGRVWIFTSVCPGAYPVLPRDGD